MHWKLLLLIYSLTFYTSAQQVTHYQRKVELDSILMPYDTYESELFMIKFTDSLYQNAEITVKKSSIKEIKSSCYIIVENNQFTVNSIQVKGKRRFRELKKVIGNELNTDLTQLEPGDHCYNINNKGVKLRYQDMGRKKVLTLIKSSCLDKKKEASPK